MGKFLFYFIFFFGKFDKQLVRPKLFGELTRIAPKQINHRFIRVAYTTENLHGELDLKMRPLVQKSAPILRRTGSSSNRLAYEPDARARIKESITRPVGRIARSLSGSGLGSGA